MTVKTAWDESERTREKIQALGVVTDIQTAGEILGTGRTRRVPVPMDLKSVGSE